jgi:hypothetical protein
MRIVLKLMNYQPRITIPTSTLNPFVEALRGPTFPLFVLSVSLSAPEPELLLRPPAPADSHPIIKVAFSPCSAYKNRIRGRLYCFHPGYGFWPTLRTQLSNRALFTFFVKSRDLSISVYFLITLPLPFVELSLSN